MDDEEIFQKWAKEGKYRFFTTEDAECWLDGTANKSMFLKLMAKARADERVLILKENGINTLMDAHGKEQFEKGLIQGRTNCAFGNCCNFMAVCCETHLSMEIEKGKQAGREEKLVSSPEFELLASAVFREQEAKLKEKMNEKIATLEKEIAQLKLGFRCGICEFSNPSLPTCKHLDMIAENAKLREALEKIEKEHHLCGCQEIAKKVLGEEHD